MSLIFKVPQGNGTVSFEWLSVGLFVSEWLVFVRKSCINSATSARDRISNNNDSKAPTSTAFIYRFAKTQTTGERVYALSPLWSLFHPWENGDAMQTDYTETVVIAVKQTPYFPCGITVYSMVKFVCSCSQTSSSWEKLGKFIRQRNCWYKWAERAAYYSQFQRGFLSLLVSLLNTLRMDDVCCKQSIDAREKSVSRKTIKPFVDFVFCNHFPLDLCS